MTNPYGVVGTPRVDREAIRKWTEKNDRSIDMYHRVPIATPPTCEGCGRMSVPPVCAHCERDGAA